MLVVNRYLYESLVLTLPDGRRVEVKVVEIVRGAVRLGISAARDIPVHRSEIQEAINHDKAARLAAEQTRAASTPATVPGLEPAS